MQTIRISSSRSRRSLFLTSSTSKDPDDDFTESSSSSSSCSRPSSKRSSCSRLSTDSGAGSFDDPQATTTPDRRFSSPDFWIERRHTAPIRKLLPFEEGEGLLNARPNTVWGGCSPRCSLSKYAPLPAIGTQVGGGNDNERPVRRRVFENSDGSGGSSIPVRRRCFQGPLDIDDGTNESYRESVGEDCDSDSELTVVNKRAESVLSSLDVDEDVDVTDSYQEYKPQVRRQCFMETSDGEDDDGNQNEPVSYSEPRKGPPLFSLTLEDSETDSDFDEEPDSTNFNQQEEDDDNNDNGEETPRKGATLIRSATFTIEKERPDIRGPFLTVAVRLPDSTRIEEQFECRETLGFVCKTALDKAGVSHPQKYVIITNEVPRRTFSDMTMTLKEAGIDDKTLLYLESLDDSESE